MDVSIVITNWNGRKLLEKNLPAVLKAAESPLNQIKEILVVDDFSNDDSVSFLEKNFPQIKTIKQPRNFGYSATCNTGVKNSTSELVAILNNDVLPEKNFMEASLPHFKNEKVFSVSFNEGKFGVGKLQWQKGFLQIVPVKPCYEVAQTDWPNGGSSVFRKNFWQQIKGMNQIFLPFYFEDIDLGVRAKKAGFICLWEPKSKVQHKHEATINPNSFKQSYIDSIKQRNHLLLTWLNLNNIGLFLKHFKGLGKRILSTPGYIKIVLLAFLRLITFSLKCQKIN